MKTLSLAIITAAIVLSSCSSSMQTAATEYDDVYYDPSNVTSPAAIVAAPQPAVSSQDAMNAQAMNQQQTYTKSVPVTEENLSDYELYALQQEAEMLGTSYAPEGSEALYAEQYSEFDTLGQYGQEGAPVIVNNYNYYTDPTDYYYSSNLRRFSDSYYGWNYYDPYYTDLYWYTGSALSWGISMGWGYPGWGMSFSYGYPYRPYYGYGGYGGWYDPWYSWGYGGYYGGYYPYYGGSYWAGYNTGWWNGYYYGSGGAYYPESYYRYGHMDSRHSYGYSYRPRETASSTKGSTAGDPRYRSRTTASTKSATATRDARSVSRNTVTGTSSAAQQQQRTRTNTAARNQVSSATNNAAGNQVRTTRTTQAITAQPRSNTSGTQRGTYMPTYSKPRTSSTSSYNNSVTQSRTYNQAATQQGNRTTINRSSAAPTRSSATYSRPSSSTRSSSTYSRPSSSTRSSSSYSSPSAPSRSSGSVSRSSGSVSRSSGSVSRSSGSVSRSSGGGSVSRSSGGASRSSGSSGSSRR